jgi:hypothetical protein
MSAGKRERQPGPKHRGHAAKTMPKGRAMLLLAGLSALFLSGAGLIFWAAAPTVVRCELAPEGRIDVTVERRVLGWHTIFEETVPDVVQVFSVRKAGGKRSGGGSSPSQHVLMLRPRQGPDRQVSGISSWFESGPKGMAQQMNEFIRGSFGRSLIRWWVPWLLNILAVPFVFVSLLMLWGLGEGLLRAPGLIKRASVPTNEDS